jgi:hypothetical protein
MIKALLLIFEPVATWERIARARHSVGFILGVYLVPFLMLTCAGEGYGLVQWGRQRGEVPHLEKFSIGETLIFEGAQFLLSLVVVCAAAKMIKSVGETFHGRHTYTQAFTAVAYSLGPLYLLRLLDIFPRMFPWASWGIGIALAIAVLYHGLPRMIVPDPSHALGLFFIGALLLIVLTGLVRFITYWYLDGRFGGLEAYISHITGP